MNTCGCRNGAFVTRDSKGNFLVQILRRNRVGGNQSMKNGYVYKLYQNCQCRILQIQSFVSEYDHNFGIQIITVYAYLML